MATPTEIDAAIAQKIDALNDRVTAISLKLSIAERIAFLGIAQPLLSIIEDLLSLTRAQRGHS
jgi:hypothetical protein